MFFEHKGEIKIMEKKKGCGFVSVCFILSIGIFFGLTTWIMLQAR